MPRPWCARGGVRRRRRQRPGVLEDQEQLGTTCEEGYIRLERLDDGVGMCAMLTYLTAVEVDEPKCSDEAFCNANGTASKATKASNVGGGVTATTTAATTGSRTPAERWPGVRVRVRGRARREAVRGGASTTTAPTRRTTRGRPPLCSSDAFAARPSMPDGCGFDDGQGGYGEDDMTGLGAGVGATCTAFSAARTRPT